MVDLNGRFLNRTPLRGRFPKAAPDPKSPGLLSFFRGDTIRLDIQIFDEAGLPQDLGTPTSIVSTWKDDECFIEALFVLDLTDGITILDAANGIIRVELSPDRSGQLIPASYVFDVEVELDDGTIGTVIKQYVEIVADVTDRFA